MRIGLMAALLVATAFGMVGYAQDERPPFFIPRTAAARQTVASSTATQVDRRWTVTVSGGPILYFGPGASFVTSVDPEHKLSPTSLSPLDETLQTGPAQLGGHGPLFAIAVTRRFTPRMSAVGTIEFGRTGTRFTNEAKTSLQQSAASFRTFWTNTLAVVSADPHVESSVALSDDGREELTAVASMRADLWRAAGHNTVYVTFGPGLRVVATGITLAVWAVNPPSLGDRFSMAQSKPH